jgi:cytochrome c oxidase subunit 2
VKYRRILGVLCFALVLAVDGWGKGDVKRGEDLYAMCVSCHGADGGGNVTNSTPRLSGQYAWYLVRQLKNFRTDKRGYDASDVYGKQMRDIAKTLKNNAAISDVVAYIRTLESPESPPSLEGDPEKGKTHYKSCLGCHGARGEGRRQLFTPRINHQHDWYVLRQLLNFRRDFRGTHPSDGYGGRMWAAARAIPDDETLRDIVAYLKTLD